MKAAKQQTPTNPTVINTIRLQHFRSYSDHIFHFKAGVNVIAGPNASGKTNLIESIMYIATGSSYRNDDRELIQHAQQWARIDAEVNDGQRVAKILLKETGTQKEFKIANKQLQRLIGNKRLPIVLFEPEYLTILSGSPDKRRSYLDSIQEQISLGYSTILRQYKRTLTQRNKLLKKRPIASQQELFPWDVRLSDLGAQIIHERSQLLERINQLVSEVYSNIAGGEYHISLDLPTESKTENYASYMVKQLQKYHELDTIRGYTGFGPHREDIVICINKQPFQQVASRGESRSLLLALKIIEMQFIEQAFMRKPILLLDDVFGELDASRRQALTRLLIDHQTFVTTTDADLLNKVLGHSNNIITTG